MKPNLTDRLGEIVCQHIPTPGGGQTPMRHRLIADVAREDVSLAKLAEAHWDAVAILSEAGLEPVQGKLYAVWASEIPGEELSIAESANGPILNGSKPFCSGLNLADRALVTVALPEQRLVDVDLRLCPQSIRCDLSAWKTEAFLETQTGAITFHQTPISSDNFVGDSNWYLNRPGFWHGACGPAACWTGGVAGLLDFARLSSRKDPHTLAHLAAMESCVWAMFSLLAESGREIDGDPLNTRSAQVRALKLRHLTETMGTELLHHFARAYGPHPLAMNGDISRRYQEVNLYMRQSHAERDLEILGGLLI